MRLRSVLAGAVLVVTASACAGQEKPAPPAEATPTAPKPLAFGEGTTIPGEKGHPLKVTPIGVYYSRGTGQFKPATKWFAAVAVRVHAVEEADKVPAPASGSFWRVAQPGGLMATTLDGNATAAPWIGSVNTGAAITDQGDTNVMFVTFDLPVPGGVLQWTTADGANTQWKLPARNSGQGTKPVIKSVQ
jgi:hypothetical protein